MNADRAPVPVQAMFAMAPAALLAGLCAAAWRIALLLDVPPGTLRYAAAVLFPIVVAVGGLLQHRFVRRSMATGMVDTTVSPLAVTLGAMLGAAIGAACAFVLAPSDAPTRQTGLTRHAIGFSTFIGLLLAWLGTLAGMWIGRRR